MYYVRAQGGLQWFIGEKIVAYKMSQQWNAETYLWTI